MSGTKLSIYVVERDCKTHFHCFIALVDETEPSEVPNVIEQIHFNDNFWDFMEPEFIEGFRHTENLEPFTFFPYIGGTEKNILPLWNHILKMAKSIKGREVEFEAFSSSPTAVNCRAGVKSAIESLGLEFFSAYTKCYLGTEAFQPSYGQVFDYGTVPPDLNAMREDHRKLVLVLN